MNLQGANPPRDFVAWPPILVRYGEIGIKSRGVRSQFERKLVERMEEQLLRRGVESEVKRDYGRVFVRASDTDKAIDAICHTFGVVSASAAVETKATPEAVAEVVLGIAKDRMPENARFAIRVKRSGTHPFTSLDVAKECASRILTDLEDRKPAVDLNDPTFELFVEVRDGGAFVFEKTHAGPGGLPLGSQGRIGILVDSPRAAYAAWLVAKRGSSPYFFATNAEQARQQLAPLSPWLPEYRIIEIGGNDRAAQYAELQSQLAKHKCVALVTADGAEGAVRHAAADQTLGFPVFRPLVGYEGPRFAGLEAEVAQ